MGNAELKKIARAKEEEAVKTAASAAGKLVEEIAKISGVMIFAQIMPVGKPEIKVEFLTGKKPKRNLFESKKSYLGRLTEIKGKAGNQFVDFCNTVGVIPFAKISEFGAQIFYTLTEAKRKEVNGVHDNPPPIRLMSESKPEDKKDGK